MDTLDIGACYGLRHFVAVRECIGKIEGIIIRFLEHDGDLLNVVVGADNLQRRQVSDHRTHIQALPQANDRYTRDPSIRTHGVKRMTMTGRNVDSEGRTSESPTAPARGTALKLSALLSMISFT